MPTKIRFAYCNVCKQEMEQSARKPLTTMQKMLWIIVIVGTLGIALIAYAIYLSNKLKIYCPNCFTKLEYSDKPFEKPKKKLEKMTPKEKILDKAGLEVELEEEVMKPAKHETKVKKKKRKEEKEEKEKIFCPYCGEELEEKIPICSYCKAVLEW